MAIPPLDQNGRLPAGRHTATKADIARVFVDQAPNRERRRLIFDAFDVYTRIVADLLPGSVLWINGGFVTHKTEAPSDIDLVIVADPTVPLPPTFDQDALIPLLTLTDLEFQDPFEPPGQTRKRKVLHPMGELVDAYLTVTTNARQLAYWDDWWSKVKTDPAVSKGYLEVAI